MCVCPCQAGEEIAPESRGQSVWTEVGEKLELAFFFFKAVAVLLFYLFKLFHILYFKIFLITFFIKYFFSFKMIQLKCLLE